jgi:hypothetical protein
LSGTTPEDGHAVQFCADQHLSYPCVGGLQLGDRGSSDHKVLISWPNFQFLVHDGGLRQLYLHVVDGGFTEAARGKRERVPTRRDHRENVASSPVGERGFGSDFVPSRSKVTVAPRTTASVGSLTVPATAPEVEVWE